MTDTWPLCGHPKTPENTASVGRYRSGACRECRRKSAREWAQRKSAEIRANREQPLTAALREEMIAKLRSELIQCRLEMIEAIA